MRAQILRLSFALALILACSYAVSASEPTIKPQVDPRVELLSIVFRMAGSPEYSMSPLKTYTADIDAYFSPYKEHPAVALARKLMRDKDVGFDAVMALAVHLSSPPALKPLIAFTSDVPDSRFGKDNATLLAQRLADFYRDAHFEKFLANHQPFYNLAEDRFRGVLSNLDLNWFKTFYGDVQTGQYHLILGMNNGGGNYGPRVVWPDGHEDFFSIIGAGNADNSGNPTYDASYLDLIVHEFSHSFVNPAFALHKAEFTSAGRIYQRLSGQMNALAYGTSDVMVEESLVRSAVLLYLEFRNRSSIEVQRKLHREQANGFVWIDELLDLLHQYSSQRSRYPTFETFMPVVAQFYRSLAPRIMESIATFNQRCVHVTGMQPFPNHSATVDPATKEIVITFDKPLEPGGYSINLGPEGKEHFPISGEPEFLTGNRSIKLPIVLKPDWDYAFVLTPRAFASPDGYPLETYTVSFKTKP